jgi:hypothetical protein
VDVDVEPVKEVELGEAVELVELVEEVVLTVSNQI